MELKQEQFKHIGLNEEKSQAIVRPSMTYWQDAWRRLRKNPVAMISLLLIIVFAIMSFVGPAITPYNYYENNLVEGDVSPNAQHWFGTDQLGRDIFSRVLDGTKISLFVGITAVAISLSMGVLFGAIAGYSGGKTDAAIMRLMDMMLAIPSILLELLLWLPWGRGWIKRLSL
jgi:oligopeptide transport system permease protein